MPRTEGRNDKLPSPFMPPTIACCNLFHVQYFPLCSSLPWSGLKPWIAFWTGPFLLYLRSSSIDHFFLQRIYQIVSPSPQQVQPHSHVSKSRWNGKWPCGRGFGDANSDYSLDACCRRGTTSVVIFVTRGLKFYIYNHKNQRKNRNKQHVHQQQLSSRHP